jgi:RNase PH
LCYEEDSTAEVDMNIIMTGGGGFVEIQGTGEAGTFSQEQLLEMLALGKIGVAELLKIQKEVLNGLALT